ncbi:MAG TPA: hypothetical protein VMT18_11360 [Planctomycetota bacterium]|nr:hypothetical protein [Planctomycetota bacterium]
MRPEARLHLRALDSALLALADERARLLAREPGRAATEDLLRRHDGPLVAGDVRALFELLDRACSREVAP